MSGWSSEKEARQVIRDSIKMMDPERTGLPNTPTAYNMTAVIRDYLVPGHGGGWKPVQYDEATFHDILRKHRRSKGSP